MPDHQNDARRRLLVALAIERSRAPERFDGVLRRALEGDERAVRRLAPRREDLRGTDPDGHGRPPREP